jgi:hypothetical protein
MRERVVLKKKKLVARTRQTRHKMLRLSYEQGLQQQRFQLDRAMFESGAVASKSEEEAAAVISADAAMAVMAMAAAAPVAVVAGGGV